jgi:hypothetical protein
VRLLYSGILKISSLCVQKQNVLKTAYETPRRSTRAAMIWIQIDIVEEITAPLLEEFYPG